MEDAFFVTICNHRIQHYKLIIRVRDGRYFATIPAPAVRIPALIFIRSWDDERKYIADKPDYTKVQSYSFYNTMGEAKLDTPLQGANAAIGFRNYAFTSETEIEFLPDTHGDYEIDTRTGILPTPVYLIDYTVDPAYCPRCGGKLVVRDVYIDDTGSARLTTGKEKIKQQVIKALLTPLGWDLSDPQYGSELPTLIGKPITEDVRIIIQTTVVQCVNHLMSNTPIEYTPEETISSIDGITIEELGTGNDAFAIKVIVSNRLGERIDCSIAFNLE